MTMVTVVPDTVQTELVSEENATVSELSVVAERVKLGSPKILSFGDAKVIVWFALSIFAVLTVPTTAEYFEASAPERIPTPKVAVTDFPIPAREFVNEAEIAEVSILTSSLPTRGEEPLKEADATSAEVVPS